MPEFQLILLLFLTSFWRVEFCCVGKYLADQKLRATFCLNNSIEMETLTLQKCILLNNISSTQKQIWRPFLCRRNFLKKANCFKSWGEKRLQKVDLIEYIFLPQNFLRRVCLQKPQGRECDREARGKNMLPMVENSHYSIGTSRSSTLLLQYIHWFFVELLQLEA